MGLGQLKNIVGVPRKPDWCETSRAGPGLVGAGPAFGGGGAWVTWCRSPKLWCLGIGWDGACVCSGSSNSE